MIPLDNNDAERRHGVEPTYKKKKGFQPLQMNWGRYFVDAVFRGGDKHSNYGDTVQKMIRHMVNMASLLAMAPIITAFIIMIAAQISLGALVYSMLAMDLEALQTITLLIIIAASPAHGITFLKPERVPLSREEVYI